MNRLMEKLKNGQFAIGTHISFCDSTISELLGNAGFDYLWIDMEHTAVSLQCVQQHLISARAAGVAGIVRVPWNDPVRAKPVLEMGPDGIIFPQVNSYDEAVKAVASCQYPPKGNRGFGPRRAVQYGMRPLPDYLRCVDEELLRILQVEHISAVEDIERIVQVEGISAFVIGPCDLAASMGHISDPDHPACIAASEHVLSVAKRAGIPVGMSLGRMSRETMAAWRQRGLAFLSLGGDAQSLCEGATRLCRDMRETLCSR